MVVQVDKVKQCMGDTPVSWLGTEHYNVIPVMLETDVLPNMFGGVDRSGVSTSADDAETNAIVRPKQNAGIPARFLSRVYAVCDDALINSCTVTITECVDNDEPCFFRDSEMKRTAKKQEFEYRCFPCREQDDKARTYASGTYASEQIILHMVNTHVKFRNDVRHNP